MNPQPYPKIIGLTGGIASGKSTIADRWRHCGASVIDADLVAREVVRRGQPAYIAIKETFGDDILGPDLELDRPKLGRIVFADTHQLEILNGIVHPAMMQRIGELVQKAHKKGRPWIVYEAALILEKGLSPTLAEVISVISDPATQLRRLMQRNGLTEAEGRDRMSAQTDNATRLAKSDTIIQNKGSLDELLLLADQHFERLVDTYGEL